MRPSTLPLFLLCCLGTVQGAQGQVTQDPGNPLPREVFPAGASLSWGLGPVSLQDEYISKERYSGSLPSLSLQWARYHERSGFRVEMDLATSSDVWSHQVSTTVTEFALDLDFLYPLATVPIGSRQAFLFLGPSSGISVLVNDQQIASHGMEVALSFASLFSLGAVCDGVFPISSRLTALGSVRVALVSAGIRMVDLMADQEESSLKLLSVLSGTRAVGSLGMRYRALDWVSVGLGYQGRLYRVTPWDPLISTRDHLTLALVLGH